MQVGLGFGKASDEQCWYGWCLGLWEVQTWRQAISPLQPGGVSHRSARWLCGDLLGCLGSWCRGRWRPRGCGSGLRNRWGAETPDGSESGAHGGRARGTRSETGARWDLRSCCAGLAYCRGQLSTPRRTGDHRGDGFRCCADVRQRNVGDARQARCFGLLLLRCRVALLTAGCTRTRTRTRGCTVRRRRTSTAGSTLWGDEPRQCGIHRMRCTGTARSAWCTGRLGVRCAGHLRKHLRSDLGILPVVVRHDLVSRVALLRCRCQGDTDVTRSA
ncbi:Uncharacterised protein [Mycobacteroides abscessus subsp. abscessus]|nr:Uncharacterised protein [Mycobacteroides abscessus subsp. abscessus]